jgi:hypothetical protein
VFTARYALSPYIKQIRFVFKGLKPAKVPVIFPGFVSSHASLIVYSSWNFKKRKAVKLRREILFICIYMYWKWILEMRPSLCTDVTQHKMVAGRAWAACPLKMGLMGCCETSVNIYQPTPRNIPGKRRLQLHRGGRLKSIRIWSAQKIYCTHGFNRPVYLKIGKKER